MGNQLLYGENKVILIIEDDGIGFNTGLVHKSIGLANIRSRVESLSGKLELTSAEGDGTFVRISIPWEASAKMTA